ncbi:hypothetical protein Cgig2_013505 [Carnegiea gigantea]|uniref:Uncharacterized protein n=1 Tax=Carnegiea gigantea TaxID=171969 RepID=A0A9Q1K255_9CARY|nr:hypothetical protein Cgig2_013505 [Carnegiea gigantea]
MEVREHPILRKPPPMTSAPKPHNARKYCEFYEQNSHTTAECRELRKALHEPADKGQTDRFLKRGLRFLRRKHEPVKARNLEVDLFVVDVPMSYNIILERPTLHKVKAVIASYLQQLQFEADDGSVGVSQGDQRTARKCCLASEPGQGGLSQIGKKPRIEPPLTTPEALVIHTIASAEARATSPQGHGVPALPSRGVVPSSSSPSSEGGMNSTSSGSRPSALAHWRSST